MPRSRSLALAALIVGLLTQGCGPPPEPTVNLNRAVQIGDLDQIRRHIAWGTDLNQPDPAGDTPLHVAARMGKVEIVRDLAKHGARLDAENGGGQTPLDLALARGKTQAADVLVKAGAPLDPQAALVDLVRAGVSDRDSFVFLLGRGADMNRLDAEGRTPLHLAVSLGRLETVKRLLARGADVNRPNADGATPLALARGLEADTRERAKVKADILRALELSGARLEATAAPGSATPATVSPDGPGAQTPSPTTENPR